MTIDLILSADWHLHHERPGMRLDDWLEAIDRKIAFLASLELPILVAGDVFHRWKQPQWFLSWLLERLPGEIYAIPGNHDLSSHRTENYPQSALKLLEAAGRVRIAGNGLKLPVREAEADNSPCTIVTSRNIDNFAEIYGFPLETPPKLKNSHKRRTRGWDDKRMIGMGHLLVGKPKGNTKLETARSPESLTVSSDFDLILTGDHHASFDVPGLVNPGPLLRHSIDEAKHKPMVYGLDLETMKLKKIFIPGCNPDVFNPEPKERKKEREDQDARIASFVESIREGAEIELSFEKNMSRLLTAKRIRKPVKELIHEAMDYDDE